MQTLAPLLLATIILALSPSIIAATPPPPDTPDPKPAAVCSDWRNATGRTSRKSLKYIEGRNGWFFLDTDISAVKLDSEVTLGLMAQFVRSLKSKGTTLAIMVTPPRGLAAPKEVAETTLPLFLASPLQARNAYHATIRSLAMTGAIVPDLLKSIDSDNTGSFDLYRRYDVRWRPEGARLFAGALAQAVAAVPAIAQQPNTIFRTQMIGRETIGEPDSAILASKCKLHVSPEEEPLFETTATEDANGRAPVVLVGSQFSAQKSANFAGFLAEALSLKVRNTAMETNASPADYAARSLIGYLGSADFRKAPPPLLVWEIDPNDLPNEMDMRQALGTLQGECLPASAAAAGEAALGRGETTALELRDDMLGSTKAAHYIDVSIASAQPNRYQIRLDYNDLTREIIEVDVTDSLALLEHNNYLLSPERTRLLKRISVRPDARTDGKVAARLCPARP